jgi:cupin fold WbuC family metalloprotein
LSDITLITDALARDVIRRAEASARRRINFNFHTGPDDNPHRFLNILLQNTYVAPHRHLQPPKAETFLVFEGYIALYCFEDGGRVRNRHLIGRGPLPEKLPAALEAGSGTWGIDLQPGVWHTVTAITPHAVCFEIKPGPWDPATDKEFAPWAPLEGEPGAEEYLRRLLDGAER